MEVPNLSEMMNLGLLWNTLSQCLLELEHTPDHHAVLVLQVIVHKINPILIIIIINLKSIYINKKIFFKTIFHT